jgi:methyl-accepting chemotaxis protein
MSALRRVNVVTRMVTGFVIIAVCVVAIWLIALSSAGQTRRSAGSLGAALARVEAAKQIKFRSADFNGWQTAYAFDIVRGAPGAAQDSASSRAAFLSSMASFSKELDALSSLDLSADERSALDGVRTAFGKFGDVDKDVIAKYREGTPAAIAAANDLVLGTEIQLFQQISDGVDKLVKNAQDQAVAAEAAAQSSASSTRNLATTVGILALLGAVALAALLTLSITRPLGTLRTRLADIAEGEGDLTKRLEVAGKDEFTAVSGAFNRFVEKIAGTVRGITDSASAVAAASEELSAVSSQIAATAHQTSTQSGVVVTAADEVSGNVQTVAAGAEELSASIREISSNATEAARVGDHTMTAARTTHELIGKLGDSSREIGDVVKVITAIAEQTNLLALNATIEAARAGEAGKGFAVVAGEVKDLAQETAKSTGNIAGRVQSIQQDTSAAVAAISEIVDIIGKLGDYQTTIASAVEEQTATTNEMSRSINQAAASSAEIATNIAGIAEAARTTTSGVADATQAAEELSRTSHQLRSLVSQFRV